MAINISRERPNRARCEVQGLERLYTLSKTGLEDRE
jgi:hypothetical protein